MFHANTVEQFKIAKWLEEHFYPEGIRRVELVTRNSVRITDRDHQTALVICKQDGEITLMDDVETC